MRYFLHKLIHEFYMNLTNFIHKFTQVQYCNVVAIAVNFAVSPKN